MQELNVKIQEKLDTIFNDEMLYGFSKFDSIKSVVVMLKPYSKDIKPYTEQEYHEMLSNDCYDINNQMDIFIDFLNANGINNYIPNPVQKDEIDLLAELSFKYHATKAGLGFIGKNDLFISHKYGARVRITAVVIDKTLPYYKGEAKSKCSNCTDCVKACPYDCLHDKLWHENIKRDEIINYKKCNDIRKRLLASRKHECGYCLLACPYAR